MGQTFLYRINQGQKPSGFHLIKITSYQTQTTLSRDSRHLYWSCWQFNWYKWERLWDSNQNHQWKKESLRKNYHMVEEKQNSSQTKIRKRNQQLFWLHYQKSRPKHSFNQSYSQRSERFQNVWEDKWLQFNIERSFASEHWKNNRRLAEILLEEYCQFISWLPLYFDHIEKNWKAKTTVCEPLQVTSKRHCRKRHLTVSVKHSWVCQWLAVQY